jgi:hypothetical protein
LLGSRRQAFGLPCFLRAHATERFRQARKSAILARMPKKKEPVLDPKKQLKRFIEPAHEQNNFQECSRRHHAT